MNIQAINAELARIGYKAVKLPKKAVDRLTGNPAAVRDWISEQERKVRAVSLKSQSAFWKAQQLRNLKIRRRISPEYEAFITRNW